MNIEKRNFTQINIPRKFVYLTLLKEDISVLFDIVQTQKLRYKSLGEVDNAQALTNISYALEDYMRLVEDELSIKLRLHIYELEHFMTSLAESSDLDTDERVTVVKARNYRKAIHLWCDNKDMITDFFENTTMNQRVKTLKEVYWLEQKDNIL